MPNPSELQRQTEPDVACPRCEGDGKAHGADRPFEWSGPGTYPGPCPVCKGTGKKPDPARELAERIVKVMHGRWEYRPEDYDVVMPETRAIYETEKRLISERVRAEGRADGTITVGSVYDCRFEANVAWVADRLREFREAARREGGEG